MTPAEIERVFDWYSADPPQNVTFQREIQRWSTYRQDLKDKPSSLFVAFTALTTVLPILFQYCYKYCYSDSRNLWAVMKAGGLAL